MPFSGRWTIVFNDPCLKSLKDRLYRSHFTVVQIPFSTTSFMDRWTIVFNYLFWRLLTIGLHDRFLLSLNIRAHLLFLLSLNDILRPPLLDDRWIFICHDSFPRFVNDRSQPSHLKIVERTLSTIPFVDQRTIVTLIHFTNVQRLFSKNPFCDCWTIVFNDPFC